ncbi:putative ABC transporter permease subunit [Paenibacillus flagellatus]|uniref:Uncharacterized protein n=1 Tax=Paenibacillus flagellatus TaxID=2211139 RepID=A0A2V5KAU3_9BACL|nr:hypothetical protein [Paenibacillus flagellatus]PYI56598.1 hypothetical protein DLM86_06420 [Paenibacillus flagellatus]
MNKTLSLTRVLLRNGGGRFAKSGKKAGKLRGALPVLLLLAFVPLMFTLASFVSVLYDALAPIGQEGVVLALGLSAVSTVVFMFGIFYVITVFYMTQDVEHLLPLPLKPVHILTAKFLTVLLYEYLTQLVLLLPLLIVFGVKDGGGPLYYAYAVFIFIALPVLPLVLASVVAMAIMSFSGVARNKDRFRMLGGVAAVLFSVGFNLVIQRSVNGTMSPEKLQQMMLGGDNSLIGFATRAFPNVRLAANALLKETELSGLVGLALFVGLSAAVYLVFMALGQTFYFKGVMGLSESSSRRVALSGTQLDRLTSQQSALKALVTKELRLLMRTPPFFLNCVLMSFIWPVLLLVPVLTQPNVRETLGMARSLVQSEPGASLVVAAGTALLLFVSGANATASTSVSREGSGFFVSKFLPVPYGRIIAAKVLTGWIVTGAGAALLLVVASVLLRLPPAFALLLVAAGAVASLYTCLTGILIDIWMPKLHWDNEQKAVKQNMNGLFNMLVALLTAALLFFAVFRLGLGTAGSAALVIGALAVANAALYRLIRAKGPGWYDKIEA